MISLFIRLLINAIVLLLIARYMPSFAIDNFGSAVFFALILGVVNAIIGPVVKILTLPISILTLGLFTLVINAVLFWLASFFVFGGVRIESFAAAFWGSLVFSIISWIVSLMVKK